MKPDDEFHDYSVEYPYGGSWWVITIKARNPDEAAARLKALGWGKVAGRVGLTLPDYLPFWLVKLIVWFMNKRDGNHGR